MVFDLVASDLMIIPLSDLCSTAVPQVEVTEVVMVAHHQAEDMVEDTVVLLDMADQVVQGALLLRNLRAHPLALTLSR